MTQPALSAVAGIVQVEGAEVLVVEVPDSPRVVERREAPMSGGPSLATAGRPVCRTTPMRCSLTRWTAVPWTGQGCVSAVPPGRFDPLEFERLRQLTATAGDRADRLLASLSDREIASALGLVRTEAEVTVGTLLLFGRSEALRRFLPTHEAAFQVLRGLEVEVDDFLPYPCCGSPRRCSPGSRPGTARKSCSSGCFAWRCPPTPRRIP